MVRILLLTGFVVLTSFTRLSAQLQQPNRFEVALGDLSSPYEVIKGGDNSLFLFRQVFNDTDSPAQLWEVMKLDTALQATWRQAYSIDEGLIYAKHYYHHNKLHLLFTNGKTGNTDLELVTINTDTGIGEYHKIENFIPFNLTDLTSSDYGVLIGGYYNYRPLVLFYHFESRKVRVLPGFYREKSDLVQLKVNTDETVDVIISGTSYGNKKNRVLEIKTFDHQGDLLRSTLLDKVGDKSLLFGRSCDWKGTNKLVAGTYGRRYSEYSRGVFLANINKFGEHQVNFYNYGELGNFFSYMRAKRQKRVQNRIERRKVNDKKVKFNYRLLVHDILEQGDEFIMLGEAFYPKYIHPTAASAVGIFQQAGRSGTETIFDGYRYTHAVVLGFDRKGKLLWDNSFEITDVKTFEREQFVKASVEKDRIVLLYIYDDVIRSKIIQNDQVVEGKAFDDVKLKFDSDYLSESHGATMAGLDNWYGNTFYAYGVQNIKNLGMGGKELKRRVFYINKLRYN